MIHSSNEMNILMVIFALNGLIPDWVESVARFTAVTDMPSEFVEGLYQQVRSEGKIRHFISHQATYFIGVLIIRLII